MTMQAGAGVPATHEGSGTVVVTVAVSPALALLSITPHYLALLSSPTSAQGWSLEQQPAPPRQLSCRLASSCSATITLTYHQHYLVTTNQH